MRQHRVLRNLRKNKDIVITKPDKENEVVILDRKLYNNAIVEITSGTSKLEKLNEYPPLKHEASLQRFLRKLKQKSFFNEIECNKLYPSGCAPARTYGTPKMHQFSSSDSFPNFVQLFHLYVLLIIILPVSFVIFSNVYFLMITLAKILFLLFLQLRMQIFPKMFLFPTMQLDSLLIFYFKNPLTWQ